MISLIVSLCYGLLTATPDGSASLSSEDLRAYQSAKEQAGHNAGAHVKLALWCEARGLKEQEEQELEEALRLDPENFSARGLLGQVAFRGTWERLDDVRAKLKSDERMAVKLAEYNARRDAMQRLRQHHPKNSRAEEAKAHVALGLWCEQSGLKAEALAHFTSAVVLDPYRDATWKHLGYVKHEGRWLSREQIQADRRETQAQRKADAYWEPKLRKWRSGLAGSRLQSPQWESRVTEVNDPRAVPSIVRVFRDGDDQSQSLAARLLARIDAPASSRQLTALAVASDFPSVREAAIETLKGREARDYAGSLVEMIHAPMRYHIRMVDGPGSPGALLVETPRFRMLRSYDAPTAFQFAPTFYGYVGYSPNGLPVVARGIELRKMSRKGFDAQQQTLAMIEARTQGLIAEANLKAAASQQRLIADVSNIDGLNAQAEALNARVVDVLQRAVDAPKSAGPLTSADSSPSVGADDRGENSTYAPENDEDSWHAWWYDRLGYRYEPPAQVTLTFEASPQSAPPSVYSCFVAGTPVRTIEGPAPIESLRVGDQVLAQDVTTGALSFQSVLVVHHNAPGKTLRIRLVDGDVLSASVYHRFWLSGKGWAMARELKSGDVVRTLNGPVRIESVSEGLVEPLFNLDVAQGRTFFVGRSNTLVHDNTLPDARIKPFDASSALAALGTRRP